MNRMFCIVTLVLLGLSGIANAHGPSRQKVTETVVVNASPDAVWSIIADFCSIADWHPAVHACESEGGTDKGTERLLTLGEDGGPTILEELQKYAPEQRMYKYRIKEVDVNVLPVTTYSAFLTVKDNGDGTSTVEWRGGFYRGYPNNDPPPELSDEAAVTAVTGIYTAGLASIKEIAESK